jgi:hypothetical protein
MTESMSGPTGPGTVVLDLGADVGALILDVPAALSGREIEISPAGGGAAARRTHALVRERRTAAGASHAAVYPGLPAADYTIWADPTTAAATITIRGGRVTRYRLA